MSETTAYILRVSNICKYFEQRNFHKKIVLKAVDDVSLEVKRGEIFSIVGESGCGKSTLAKVITHLTNLTYGELYLNDKPIELTKREQILQYRRDVQMVFQDPFSSINPRTKIRKAVTAPLFSLFKVTEDEAEEKFLAIMSEVGIPERLFDKLPHELSGGQLQRVAIARALIVNPKLLVADEPIAALDVSIQSQILNLLFKLQKKFGLTIVFIAHDLRVVSQFSDRVAIMYLGNIVELGSSEQIFRNPQHPYTRALIQSIPKISSDVRSHLEVLDGEVPSLFNIPKGCPFQPRCSNRTKICTSSKPKLSNSGDSNEEIYQANERKVSCFHPLKSNEKERMF
ncbi:ABC transporter ATP-binding protein [Aquibacillus saliphilus]|uniref:ABC transporter ATP-binding protein n=1 Tax=Aquibacillus saliphilus TaxID=1909422 RepID=UPI001CF0C443|nr:ABC transporter ATP-binding protein [Aquibacillus saliphilus]